MNITEEISVEKVAQSRLKADMLGSSEFGSIISDHMFIAEYSDKDWHHLQIVPFENISLSPSTLALHYGQSVFEGMKAFRMKDGSISVFRMEKHFQRLNRSLDRMCMPAIPEHVFKDGILKLVEIDANWIPYQEGHSMYIRPFVFASEARFGVKIAEEYKFIVFGGPVGPYYGNPLKLKVETQYVRAAKGGTGYAKCAGNYGGSFYPTQKARAEGYDQVLWTDGRSNQNIEESGTMNIIFMINGKVVTPATSDSILDGITRDSVLTLARDWNIPVEERTVSIKELKEAFENNTLEAAFGAGTAAVVAPVELIHINGVDYKLPALENSFMTKVKNELINIRTGISPDTHQWNTIIQAFN